jgi:hypothetical protein
MDRLMVVQCVSGRSRMCVHYAWEIFPTLILVIKRNKCGNRQELYQLKTLGSLNFIIIIITFIFLFVITIIINFFILCVHLIFYHLA